MKKSLKSDNQNAPWYKHRWPWILMAGPATVVVAGIVTAGLAVKTWDGLVADDYYKQGLSINKTKNRETSAKEAGISAEISRSGRITQVMLRAKAPGFTPPESLVLRLVHPTRNGLDQQISLIKLSDGVYRGGFKVEPQGRFNIQLEDESAQWRLSGEWKMVDSDESIMLLPPN